MLALNQKTDKNAPYYSTQFKRLHPKRNTKRKVL